jgi:hypothetical protein
MDLPEGKSSLRVYVGRNRVPIAVVLALLGVGGGAPLATRLLAPASASELGAAVDLSEVKADIQRLKDAQTDLRLRQDRQANTQDRIEDNVMTLCHALNVRCRERPARPE